MKPIIEARHLSKRYGDKYAIRDLSFALRPGRVIGFLGLNGAGKTTTINILTGRLLPTEGEVRVLGLDPVHQEKELARSISVVSDALGLYRDMSVRKNLEFFASLYDLPPARVGEVIETMQLEDHRDKKVSALSKGLTQRARLAKCLLPDPQILFLDEPTTGIDVDIARDIHRLMLELKARGRTLFLTTHNMQEAQLLCDDICILHRGELVFSDEMEHLRRLHPARVVLLETKEGKREVPLEQLAGHLRRADEIISIHTREVSLEQFFLQQVGQHAAQRI